MLICKIVNLWKNLLDEESLVYRHGLHSAVRKCIHIEIRTRFNLIHEKEWTGGTVSNICKRYGVSRKTYYKWNNRYKQKGIEGLSDNSRRPHNIKYKKITSEIEETILDLRLTKSYSSNGSNSDWRNRTSVNSKQYIGKLQEAS